MICRACDIKRGGTIGACHQCSASEPLTKGLCAACQLRERVTELAAGADPTAAAVLAPFLRTLAASENPRSTLRWFYTPGFATTRKLLAGEIPITHQGLDDAVHLAPNAVAFLRAALVDSGVLDVRDEASASFAIWQQQAVLQIALGPDRVHVRAYGTWQVARQLARTLRRHGEASRASQKHARSLLSEAIKLVCWLHEQQLELCDLHQDLVDQWVAHGATTRRRVRLFLAWLARAGVTAALEVAWDDRLPTRPVLSDDARFDLLRRLLNDREIDTRDRLAGCLVLLYAQPLTKIAALKTSDVELRADGLTAITLGRGAVPLPEPLGSIALALRHQRLQGTGGEGWLLPGRHAGTHISSEHLRARLKRHGIDHSLPGRHVAMVALAARLPAPILAQRIGIHQARAAEWARVAGATYAEYVAHRTS